MRNYQNRKAEVLNNTINHKRYTNNTDKAKSTAYDDYCDITECQTFLSQEWKTETRYYLRRSYPMDFWLKFLKNKIEKVVLIERCARFAFSRFHLIVLHSLIIENINRTEIIMILTLKKGTRKSKVYIN